MNFVVFNNCPDHVYNFTDCDVTYLAGQAVYIGGGGAGCTVNMDGVTTVDNGNKIIQDDPGNTTATITNSAFTGTQGLVSAMIHMKAGSSLTMDSVTMTGGFWNLVTCLAGSTLDMTNCYLNGGDIVVSAQGEVTMEHCTIVQVVDNPNVCLYTPNATALSSVTNCIFYNSKAGAQATNLTADVVADYNMRYAETLRGGGVVGAHDIDLAFGVDDPGFVAVAASADAGDYHLTALSPACNAGTDLGVLVDIEGSTRPMPVGSAPDLGAFEEQTAAGTAVSDWALY